MSSKKIVEISFSALCSFTLLVFLILTSLFITISLNSHLSSYFFLGKSLPTEIFRTDEISHIEDIKSLSILGIYILFILIILIIILGKQNLKPSYTLHTSITFVFIFLILILFFFGTSFHIFHKVLFPPNSWTFPSQSYLITNYSQNFFKTIALIILGLHISLSFCIVKMVKKLY